MKKTVIITGASSGVGFETSLLFARKGYRVVATMRTIEKSAPLLSIATAEGLDIVCESLDVTSSKSVNDAVDRIKKSHGYIDILINNAGAGFAKTTEHTSEEECRWVTDVNYFGVVRCTKAVLPLMRERKSGHIINITSVGGLVGQPFNEFYCAAKFAVEGYTESLASYITGEFGIVFSLVEPGGIHTEFMKSATEKTIENGQFAKEQYLPLFQKYYAGAQQRASESQEDAYQTAEEVASVILDVAQTEHPPLRIRTSDWAKNFCSLKTASDPKGYKLLADLKNRFFPE